MPKSFSKVHKHVHKKKGTAKMTALHSNSRDSRLLLRASNRDARVAKTEALRQKLNRPYLERLEQLQCWFFRGNCALGAYPDPEAGREFIRLFSMDEVRDAVGMWVERNGEELQELRDARRPGRPKSAREEQLAAQELQDVREYADSGFWMPDMMSDVENVRAFKEWKGEWIGLNVVKFVRVMRNGKVKESAWPPKGNS